MRNKVQNREKRTDTKSSPEETHYSLNAGF